MFQTDQCRLSCYTIHANQINKYKKKKNWVYVHITNLVCLEPEIIPAIVNQWPSLISDSLQACLRTRTEMEVGGNFSDRCWVSCLHSSIQHPNLQQGLWLFIMTYWCLESVSFDPSCTRLCGSMSEKPSALIVGAIPRNWGKLPIDNCSVKVEEKLDEYISIGIF